MTQSDSHQPPQEELAEIRNQIHAALSKMEAEFEKIASVLLTARLHRGAPPGRVSGHEEPEAADPDTITPDR